MNCVQQHCRVTIPSIQATLRKKVTGLEVYLIDSRGTNQDPKKTWICFSTSFGVSWVRGVQKHHKNVFTKSPCRKLFRKKRQKLQWLQCQFFLDFFVLSRFRVFLSGGSSKILQKNVLQKDRVEKVLQKNRQKSKAGCFLKNVFPFWGVSRWGE